MIFFLCNDRNFHIPHESPRKAFSCLINYTCIYPVFNFVFCMTNKISMYMTLYDLLLVKLSVLCFQLKTTNNTDFCLPQAEICVNMIIIACFILKDVVRGNVCSKKITAKIKTTV